MASLPVCELSTRHGAMEFYPLPGTTPATPIVYITQADQHEALLMNMKLTFMVVLMALMGSIIYSTGFLRLSFRRLPTCGGMFLYRYDLTRIVRFVLNFVFFQFVPLLSSAFSQSENRSKTELLLILLWMLLAEIIRKKVQGMLLPTDGSSFNRGIGRFTLMDYAYDTLVT